MTEREAIDNLQLNRPFSYTELQRAVDKAIDALEKQSMVNEILNEAEQYKLALFAVLRNHSMPVAIENGLSAEGLNMLAVKIMKQVIEKCNFETLKDLYDEALAKMEGK